MRTYSYSSHSFCVGELTSAELTALRDFLAVLADLFPENSRILPLLTRLTTLPDQNIVGRSLSISMKRQSFCDLNPARLSDY